MDDTGTTSVLVHEFRRLLLHKPGSLVDVLDVLDISSFKALLESIACSNATTGKVLLATRDLLKKCEKPEELVEPLLASCR
jgi:hypothetical protein